MGRQPTKRFQAGCQRRCRTRGHPPSLTPLHMGVAVPQAELLHEQQDKQGDRPEKAAGHGKQ